MKELCGASHSTHAQDHRDFLILLVMTTYEVRNRKIFQDLKKIAKCVALKF